MVDSAFKFQFDGTPVKCEQFGDGHINKSYKVETDCGRLYVLQKINSVAFHDVPGLMANAIAVCEHITRKGGFALHFIKALSGEYYYIDGDGEYWRSYEFVNDSVALQSPRNPEDFYLSAVAFGEFQNLLNDFPADTLVETIPNFHNTPDRYKKFHDVLERDPVGRAAGVKEEIDFYLQRESEAGRLIAMLESGELPLRVTHNDTKINNVLFNDTTFKPICVIDLDTVMPGLSAYDFGDSIRFGASTAAEDEKDLSKVSMDLELFRMYARGFIGSCPKLTDNERSVLALGSKLMTLECGMRFLADYIDGDNYFSISREEHNLDRARTHIKLVSDMESKWDEMEKIIAEES